jgi:hypothetical protein
MLIGPFRRSWEWVHRMTVDFVDAVPNDRWDFTPDPPGSRGREPSPGRLGDGFGPFCKQLRHVICVRGVYNAAMITKRADFSRSHDYYSGALTRDALRPALLESHRQFLATLETLDTDVPIYFGATPFTFDNFACEVIQHESIHHGQWSIYASLGGFETPLSWRTSWKL